MSEQLIQTQIHRRPTTGSSKSTSWTDFNKDWQKILDQFAEWGRDLSVLEDEGIPAPTAEILFKASCEARLLQQRQQSAPDFVVPSGDGGIIFEWRARGGLAASIEIRADGVIDQQLFNDGKLFKQHLKS